MRTMGNGNYPRRILCYGKTSTYRLGYYPRPWQTCHASWRLRAALHPDVVLFVHLYRNLAIVALEAINFAVLDACITLLSGHSAVWPSCPTGI